MDDALTEEEYQALRLTRARALLDGGDLRPMRVEVRSAAGVVLTERVLPLIAAINLEVGGVG